MPAILTFDELLDLAKPGAPVTYHCRAWRRDVLLRDPTAEDLDAWRAFCNRHKNDDAPFSARLLQILLCDEKGERIVPPGAEGLEALAGMPAAGVAEVAEFASTLVSGLNEERVSEHEKN